ncbi:MAG: LysE family translocator [Acidobacteria bacterium]|nr:LysE family translocator [Acidobacteriota bacterium]
MDDHGILAFAALALLLTLTPGADTMVLFRNVLRGGRRAGWTTAVGGRFGLVVHALFSSLGLSAVLAHSAAAYQTLQLVGAAYLIWLGIRSIFTGLRGSAAEAAPLATPGRRSPFFEGFLTNVLNPKTAVFYLALLPQFVSEGENVLLESLLLASLHILLSLAWYGLLCLTFARARELLARPPVRRVLDATSGAVLTALGLRLALSRG